MRTANILNQILESVLPKNVFGYIYGSGDLGDELIK
jgi:acyl-CoA reductase-like NAD-dependent aldehyde dehydrogenase